MLDRVVRPLDEAEQRFGAAELQTLRGRFEAARAAEAEAARRQQIEVHLVEAKDRLSGGDPDGAHAEVESAIALGAPKRATRLLVRQIEAARAEAVVEPVELDETVVVASAGSTLPETPDSDATIPGAPAPQVSDVVVPDATAVELTLRAPAVPDRAAWSAPGPKRADAGTGDARVTLRRGVLAAAAALVFVTAVWAFWPAGTRPLVPTAGPALAVTVDAMPWA